jgi:hypothetical protein
MAVMAETANDLRGLSLGANGIQHNIPGWAGDKP